MFILEKTEKGNSIFIKKNELLLGSGGAEAGGSL